MKPIILICCPIELCAMIVDEPFPDLLIMENERCRFDEEAAIRELMIPIERFRLTDSIYIIDTFSTETYKPLPLEPTQTGRRPFHEKIRIRGPTGTVDRGKGRLTKPASPILSHLFYLKNLIL